MLENLDHIVTKVFKARYFKHTDIMDATISSNPSYVWRSLVWSRDILHIGMYWKIGNGEKINTRRDSWIPGLSAGRITSNTTYENNVRVKSLILHNKRWDNDKLKDLFLHEIDAIQQVPIAN